MSVMRIIVNIFSFFFEAYIISVFFKAFSNGDTIIKKPLLLIVYAVFLIATIALYFLVGNEWISTMLFFILTFCISCFYKIGYARKIIGSLILCAFLYLCEIFVGLLSSAILEISVSSALDDIIYYSVGVLVSKSIALIGVKIFQYKYTTEAIQVTVPFVVAISLFPLITFGVGVVIIGGIGDALEAKFSIAGACVIILLTITDVLVFFLFENYAKQQKMKSNLEFDSAKLHIESEYLNEIIQKQVMSNKAMHDLRNQLFAIKELVKSGNERGIQKIEEICATVSAAQNIIYTNDTEIDALINSKAHTASLNGIALSCQCHFSGFGKIDRIDLCVLIGNLLDNAIEACKKFDGERYIEMSILQRANMVNLVVVNPFIGEICNTNGIYCTSKEDKYSHGFGLKSVKTIINKYDGYIELSDNINVFTVSALLPSD